jgi:response regulator RpfG family c-di-GMP phosphodiesterase
MSPGIEKALDEISSNVNTYYDPRVVEACLRLFRQKGFFLPVVEYKI